MRKDKCQERVSRRELRQFGCGLALLFVLIGSLLYWKGQVAGGVFFPLSVLLFVAFWCDWPGIRAFYAVWMELADMLARVMIRLLLTLVFLLVLTPIALLGRALGKRFVERGFREEKDSYWITHVAAESDKNYERQS